MVFETKKGEKNNEMKLTTKKITMVATTTTWHHVVNLNHVEVSNHWLRTLNTLTQFFMRTYTKPIQIQTTHLQIVLGHPHIRSHIRELFSLRSRPQLEQ
ncbi:hypothetical protein P9112_005505 [Eukaryota sp. TZLM1-RC]